MEKIISRTCSRREETREKGLKRHCSHEKLWSDFLETKRNIGTFLLSLPAPLYFHETLVLLGDQEYCIMKESKQHCSITFWVKTTGRNTVLQARHTKEAKQFQCEWHKMITQDCFDLNKSVTLWNSERSRKNRIPGSYACAWSRGEKLQNRGKLHSDKWGQKNPKTRQICQGSSWLVLPSPIRVNSLHPPLQFAFPRNQLSHSEYRVSRFHLTPDSPS